MGYISREQASDLLEVTEAVLRSWRTRRQGPTVYTINKETWYDEDEVRSFAEMQREREKAPFVVYRMYDADSALLYVGVTMNDAVRLHAHSNQKAWFYRVATVTFTRYATKSEAYAAEKAAIKEEKPLHNVRDSGKSLRRLPLNQPEITDPNPEEGSESHIDITTAAEYLGIARQTLLNWRSRGYGPPSAMIGGRVRYKPEDIDTWINDRFKENTDD